MWVPDGIAWKAFNKVLKGEIGITIAGGQDDYKDKIFRVSHLGYYDELDMIAFVGALERTLATVGYKFTVGAGLAATQNAFLTMK